MSYKENLGKVRGDTGTSYIPNIIPYKSANEVTTGYKLGWIAVNDDTAPKEISPINFYPLVYMPTIEDDGRIRFTLVNSNDADYSFLTSQTLKGDKGDAGHLATQIVPTENDLPSEEDVNIDTIYVTSDGNCFIWSQVTKDWVEIENMLKFQDYYTKQETYGKYYNYDENEKDTNGIFLRDTVTYSAMDIDNRIGKAEEAINKILNILDNGAINIPIDE